MDKTLAAHKIIEHALPHVPFEGWNQSVLSIAAEEAGYRKTDAIRVFPGGAIEAVDAYMEMGDMFMMRELLHYNLGDMKIREKITHAVRLRIDYHMQHREALRKAIALQGMPFFAAHGLKNLYRTVDTIWRAIGDSSTDFNFYTKRLTLAAVYTSTVLYWLDDHTPGFEGTWNFLDRRIADVMAIEKAKHSFKKWTAA